MNSAGWRLRTKSPAHRFLFIKIVLVHYMYLTRNCPFGRHHPDEDDNNTTSTIAITDAAQQREHHEAALGAVPQQEGEHHRQRQYEPPYDASSSSSGGGDGSSSSGIVVQCHQLLLPYGGRSPYDGYYYGRRPVVPPPYHYYPPHHQQLYAPPYIASWDQFVGHQQQQPAYPYPPQPQLYRQQQHYGDSGDGGDLLQVEPPYRRPYCRHPVPLPETAWDHQQSRRPYDTSTTNTIRDRDGGQPSAPALVYSSDSDNDEDYQPVVRDNDYAPNNAFFDNAERLYSRYGIQYILL